MVIDHMCKYILTIIIYIYNKNIWLFIIYLDDCKIQNYENTNINASTKEFENNKQKNIVDTKKHLGSQKLRKIPPGNFVPIKWSMQAKSTMNPTEKLKA